MDPRKNPFTPGAGFHPPELAGRSGAISDAAMALAQVKAGRPAQGTVVYGLRGVGKTVLLNVVEEKARQEGFHVIAFEATDRMSLGEALVPELQHLLAKLSTVEKAKQLALSALNALRGFASAFSVEVHGAKFEVKGRAEDDIVSSNVEIQLRSLLEDVGEAAKAAEQPVALLIDELQYLQLREAGREFGALLAAVHRVGQRRLPIIMFGAALPQVLGQATKQKSYAERIFRFTKVGALDAKAAAEAIRKPITAQGEAIEDDALERIFALTKGYPYFLQEYGLQTWLAAPQSPITVIDVERAHAAATAALDQSFFEARMQRVTARERDYLVAMAGLGEGPYATSAVATVLGAENTTPVTPIRDTLVKKGMIWAPRRGFVEFTVPMFDHFLRRRGDALPLHEDDEEGSA
ncbi:MAG: hypothetical protein ABS52_11070 [Gemmatimonadetes bacterium SCN 70-22]|nr:MAG: hypothetical protein ABS52_11070 [Gemmatimonadetes bacterium SCN 70-22]